MLTEAFSPARAGLAQCLDSLASQHALRWNRWLLAGGAAGAGGGRGAGAAAVRCVTFDLDDTLFPMLPPLMRAQAALVDELLPRHLPRCAAAGACTKESIGQQMRDVGQAQPMLAHDLTELRRLSLLALATTHGDPPEARTRGGCSLQHSLRADTSSTACGTASSTASSTRAAAHSL